MNYKIFIFFLFLLLISWLISGSQKNKVNACDCMGILLEKNVENNTYNTNWKLCLSLSKEISFIEEMKSCENYNNFIKHALETNYQDLINPELEKSVIIENITE